MPRYFFNVHDGGHIPDAEGVELPGSAEARMEAARLMGELLRDRPSDFWESGFLAVLVETADEPPFTLRTTAGPHGAAELDVFSQDEGED